MSHVVDLGIPSWHELDALQCYLRDRQDNLQRQHEDLHDEIQEIQEWRNTLTYLLREAAKDGFIPSSDILDTAP